MAYESDAAPANQPSSPPPPFPAAAAVLMAVSSVIFFQFSFGNSSAGDRGMGTFCAALSLTHLAGLLLLPSPRTRALGAGIGFGAAIASLLPALPFPIMLIVFMSASPLILLLGLAQFALLFVGFRAMRREGSNVSWTLGIILPIAFFAMFSSAAWRNRELMAAQAAAASAAARQDEANARQRQELLKSLPPPEAFAMQYERPVKATTKCLDLLKDTAGSYPRTLEEVRSKCHASRELPAHTRYLAAHPDAGGNTVAFTLCVTAPWHLGGFRAVTADTRGVWAIRTSTQESRACAAAWDDRPGALLHCVLDYESKNPEKGFPSTISEMGERGTNCLGYRFTPKGDSVRLRDYLDYSLTYFSDAPGPDGRISGFHITGAAPFNAEPALFVDQTGIWRATDARRERRPARPDDPPWPREKVGTP